jgi:hypothetical protein
MRERCERVALARAWFGLIRTNLDLFDFVRAVLQALAKIFLLLVRFWFAFNPVLIRLWFDFVPLENVDLEGWFVFGSILIRG